MAAVNVLVHLNQNKYDLDKYNFVTQRAIPQNPFHLIHADAGCMNIVAIYGVCLEYEERGWRVFMKFEGESLPWRQHFLPGKYLYIVHRQYQAYLDGLEI